MTQWQCTIDVITYGVRICRYLHDGIWTVSKYDPIVVLDSCPFNTLFTKDCWRRRAAGDAGQERAAGTSTCGDSLGVRNRCW